jgi:arylsulfatase A-like enzyme
MHHDYPPACVLLLCLLLAPAGCATEKVEADRPPNVVFILVDDLGWRDLSNEGSQFYQTPNIDSIAQRGMKFTRGYAACSVCSPSRASILTGTYPTKHGITSYLGDPWGEAARRRRPSSHLPPEYEQALRAKEITLAETFKAAGYKTFFAGKWHLGDKGSWPTDHGFDINKGGTRGGGPRGGFYSPYQNPNLEDGPAGESLTLRLAKETADFIEAHADQPFFAMLSFYAVHAPVQTTPQRWKKYRDKAEQMGLTANEKRFIVDRRLPVRQVQDHPVYAGLVETTDDAVGLVLAKLKALGLEDNTIICFTSDNGGVSSGDAFATSNLPLRGGKGRQWEGGIREPYYIAAPGKTRAGATSGVPVHGVDWYPTLVELAGLELPARQGVDGVSLVPLMKGGAIADRPLFWHFPHYGNQGGEPSSIITRGHWKLIYYHEDGRNELYNLANDPGEQKDLAAAQPQRTRAMRGELDAWLKQTGARFPTPDPQFDPSRRAARWERLAGPFLQRLEQRHVSYLSPDFKPNKDWWGSTPAKVD